MSILITGGAGFVGSRMAFYFKNADPNEKVVVFDNLKRRGSELNLIRFKQMGIDFIHGDIRKMADFNSLQDSFDLIVEASAEASVHAGTDGDPTYLLHTNILGTMNCLEYARLKCNKMIFLSTSRVYSIDSLKGIPLVETKNRFKIDTTKNLTSGLSELGISERFDTKGYRSLYGATKLCSEMIAQEYAATYDMDIIINRCGVIAGPGQWGKVDQGVFTLWVANHFFNKNLRYTGFGGKGKQVRDLVHPHDLFELISIQRNEADVHKGSVFNVGGGVGNSTSLKELTTICREVTSNKISINSIEETAKVDIPYYVTDASHACNTFQWKPSHNVKSIVSDIYNWLKKEESTVRHIFN